MFFVAFFCVYGDYKTQNRKPRLKVTKLKSTFYPYIPGLAQSGTEEAAKELRWPKSIN